MNLNRTGHSSKNRLLTSARVSICDLPDAETGRRIRERKEFVERQIQRLGGLFSGGSRRGTAIALRCAAEKLTEVLPRGVVGFNKAMRMSQLLFFCPEPTFDSDWRALVVWFLFASHEAVKPEDLQFFERAARVGFSAKAIW